MTRICLILIVALLTACASQSASKAKLDQFVGMKIDDVAAEFGKPSRITNMGDGTREYAWRQDPRSSGAARGTFMGVPLSKSTTNSCTVTLITDSNKRVVSYRTFGRC